MKKQIILLINLIIIYSCLSIPSRFSFSEKEFLSYVRYIITNEEKQAYLILTTSEEKEEFIREFWKKRDPTPETPRNEFREVYFQRIQQANRLFRSSRPGWLTDRGMIYILLGPPDDRESYPMGVTSEDKAIDIWIYNSLPQKAELRLEFVDYTGSNDYRLITDFSRETINSFVPGGMNLPYGTQSGGSVAVSGLSGEISTRKSPVDLELEKIQESAKAIGRSQENPEIKKEIEFFHKQVKVPPEIGEEFERNLDQRIPKKDIVLNYLRTLYFPAQGDNVHTVFLFKLKNSDLGFEPGDLIKNTLVADLDFFLRFYQMKGKELKGILKEIYIPYSIEIDKDEFSSEQEELYCIANPLPPGEYLLALAIASDELSRIGTAYVEISLPDIRSFPNRLGTSPIFFVKSLEKILSPETEVKVHRGFFYYSILKIEPKAENIFSQEEIPDIFYFIYGARPNKQKQFKIEVDYRVKRGEEDLIKYATQTYLSPFISHKIPLELGEESLVPGEYVLQVEIRDMITNLKTKKEISFEVRK